MLYLAPMLLNRLLIGAYNPTVCPILVTSGGASCNADGGGIEAQSLRFELQGALTLTSLVVVVVVVAVGGGSGWCGGWWVVVVPLVQ